MKRLLRASVFLLAFLLPIVLSAGLGFFSSLNISMSMNTGTQALPTPAYPFPDDDPTKPTVAVLLGNDLTEITDFLTPYDLFSSTDAFNVYAVAPTHHVTTLTGGLDVLPDFSLAEFDARIGRAPDVIVIPAIPGIHKQENLPILAWIKKHATPNTILLSWCVGSETLALTGLLDGKMATTHWGDIDRLEQAYPKVHWQRGVRYVDNGSLVTSAGLTSGIDALLHVLERLKGRDIAQAVAKQFHYPSFQFVDSPHIPQYSITASDSIYVLNGAYNWAKTSLGVLLYNGVGETELASVFDTYAGSLVSQTLTVSQDRQIVKSKHGLHFFPRWGFADLPDVSRFLVPGVDALRLAASDIETWKKKETAPVFYVHAATPTRFAFEAPLEDLARQENVPTAFMAAKRLEYRAPVPLIGSGWPPLLFARPLLLGCIGLLLVLSSERWLQNLRKKMKKGI